MNKFDNFHAVAAKAAAAKEQRYSDFLRERKEELHQLAEEADYFLNRRRGSTSNVHKQLYTPIEETDLTQSQKDLLQKQLRKGGMIAGWYSKTQKTWHVHKEQLAGWVQKFGGQEQSA